MANELKETELNTADVRTRLHKVKGQCDGVERMIEEGKPCEEILMQVNAAKSALHRLGQVLLERTLEKELQECAHSKAAAKAASKKTALAIDYFCRMK